MSTSGFKLAPLTGEERFIGIDATVLDFWRFAMSDLRTNTQRGYLAEYLVHRALGVDRPRREWEPWDVEIDGVRVEVKATGRVQAWNRRNPRIRQPEWEVGPTQVWDHEIGEYVGEKAFHTDVYVFAVHTADDLDSYDALDVSQWEFWVISRVALLSYPLRTNGKIGMTMLRVRKAGGEPVAFETLANRIRLLGSA